MKLKELTTEIKNRIINDFSYVADAQVYVLPDRESSWVNKAADTPGVAVVYLGSTEKREKACTKSLFTHVYAVKVFINEWDDEKICTGDANKEGLMELHTVLAGLLKGYTAYSSVEAVSAEITEHTGVSGVSDSAGTGFVAVSAFKLAVKEYS